MLALGVACASFDPEAAARHPTPARGVVVCEHPIAARVGRRVLERGGNAVDATVATALALAVVLPRAGNLGGGGFCVYAPHDTTEPPLALDFRETAPGGLTPEMFLDGSGGFVPSRALESALGVGVPGTPAGLWALHQSLGSLPFAELAAPAIRLAREGAPVSEELARDLRTESVAAKLKRAGVAAEVFYPNGEPLRAGDLLRQPQLAKTLERYAREGPAGFYRGPVSKALAAGILAEGGVLTPRDLDDYEVRWREPLIGWFRGLEVITTPPPSSGGLVLLQVLSILDGFPLDAEIAQARRSAESMGHPFAADAAPLSARAVHWWIEAMRRAFADRAAHMGDPDFHDVPVRELLSPSWIAERRVAIGEFARPDVGPMELAGFSEEGETTHISVLDRMGNAVSLTTTLNRSYGCGLMVPGTGFLLNNELDDFAIQAGVPNSFGLVGGEANALEPHKRPLSSMTPTIVRKGGQTVRWVLGAPGGPRIITAVIEVFLRVEVYGQDLVHAVSAPRLHQQWKPEETRFEEGWDPALLERLRTRGHEVEVIPGGSFARVEAILLDEPGGEPVGVADPRSPGAAAPEGLPLERSPWKP